MSSALGAVGIAGVTHLGLVTGAALAAKGYRVSFYGTKTDEIAALRTGRLPVSEPGLSELIAEYGARLRFESAADALVDAAVVFVAEDVPTDDAGRSELAGVESLFGTVAGVVAPNIPIVVMSQVPPGTVRRLAGARAHVFYQVETLVFGDAVQQALAPERFIVGAADPATPLPAAYRAVLDGFGCATLLMRYESAELAKLAINLFLAATLGATNSLAALCESLGADWAEIAPALRLDRRIGPHAYLTAGLGIGGGNIGRDLASLQQLADDHGTDGGVVAALVASSEHRRGWAQRALEDFLGNADDRSVLAILGLAYKENTATTKNSPGVDLVRAAQHCRVQTYDPVVTPDPAWHAGMVAAEDALAACEGAGALAIMTAWPKFADLDPAAVAARLTGDLVVDPYRMLDAAAARAAGLSVLSLGLTADG